jgi:hypothetical protein
MAVQPVGVLWHSMVTGAIDNPSRSSTGGPVAVAIVSMR